LGRKQKLGWLDLAATWLSNIGQDTPGNHHGQHPAPVAVFIALSLNLAFEAGFLSELYLSL
jgi:hypothetical protein